jgi:AraC-like DNA-binding protein
LNHPIGTQADGPAPVRALHARPGIGVAAHVLQGRGLDILRMRTEQPALIVVRRGIKSVRSGRDAAVRASPGQAIVLAGNQTVDFTNSVADGMHYEARWLLFDPALLDDAYYRSQAIRLETPGREPASVRLLAQVPGGLADAFERSAQALVPDAGIPDAVARQRLLETMHWLLGAGIALRNPPVNPDVSVRLRALIAGRLDDDWTAERIAAALALSETTLRRRLAMEGTSPKEVLVEARMAMALTMLQATTQPVSGIALAVGYASPSRFAVRFRQRFGFAPTAVRGHERTIHHP